jgi:competence protein ComEC
MLLFNAGFQFSFVSCLVLARVVPPLREALIHPQLAGWQGCWRALPDLSLKPSSHDARSIRFRLECLMENRRWLQPIYFLLLPLFKTVSLLSRWMLIAFLIQNETFLLSTFHANQGPGPALLANLVMVPLTSLLLFPGFLLSLLPFRFQSMAWMTEKLVDLCYGSVEFFDRWTLPDHPQAGPILLSLLALMLVVQALSRNPTMQKVLVLAILALNLGWLWCPQLGRKPQPGAYFFDVGQGDCAALVDRLGRTVMFDAGTFASKREDGEEASIENMFLARSVISRALWHIGVRQIDAIFISHLHTDHISAVGRLARNFRAAEVFLSPSVGSDDVFRPFIQTIPLRTQIHFVGAGDRTNVKDFQIDVIHPPVRTSASYGNMNENSMVVRVLAPGRVLLFTGDMSSRQEAALSGKVGHVDILKVAHHGSAWSTSQKWLDELSPALAVISVGKRNLFDHPHPVTIERLENAGIKIRRTDREGCIYLR